MANSRLNALYVLKILYDYSDEEHILSNSDIAQKIENTYGQSLDRRTISSAINDLQDFGVYISAYLDNRIGYYLETRELEESEARLLIDAVFSLSYISEAQSKEIIKKLLETQSIYKRSMSRYINKIERSSDMKSTNKEVFLNVEVINEAIDKAKKIKFNYLEYGLDKKLHPRREKPYIVSPHEMLAMNQKYYLAASAEGHEDVILFRMDFIDGIEILADTKLKIKDYELDRRIRKATYAFIGEAERIVMRCDKGILSYVIDEFGLDINIRDESEKYFFADFRAPSNGIEYWALQFLPYVEVLEPKALRENIIKSIKANLYKDF